MAYACELLLGMSPSSGLVLDELALALFLLRHVTRPSSMHAASYRLSRRQILHRHIPKKNTGETQGTALHEQIWQRSTWSRQFKLHILYILPLSWMVVSGTAPMTGQ